MRRKTGLLPLFLAAVLTFSPVWGEEALKGVATAQDMTEVEEVLEDWMVPIPVTDLKDGTYGVEVNCSSSMFKIVSAALTVEDGEATACLTMGGTGYLYVYPGTAEEAAKASEEEYIPFVLDEEGNHTFTIPVKELDAVTACAAFSKKKELWYDRSLAFLSTSLPLSAFVEAQGTSFEGIEDGIYQVEATLSGGSGKASIESPTRLVVEGGEATLTVTFSSPNYDYMLLSDTRYERVNTEGNSSFEIPVLAMDVQLPVVADTVAMSKPHEISYTIYLDSSTLIKEG